ncbi:MAG: class I SAM-dependent methyltransferase [Lachnospiraceae bacterium]|jgi:SAM-dependent methyltransferase|nr:class I SAM-dependent methyltransferase [Lachnospiraceae bacterium]
MEAYTDFAEVYDTFMGDVPYEEWADFLASLIEAYGVSRPVREQGEVQELEEAPEFEETQEELEVTEEDALISERNLVLDLGCGTGTLTELLYEKGYDMIGVDSSEEMLQIAMDKKFETQSDILYLCQDMRELDLYSTVGTVVSVCDSLNYLLMDEDVLETFRLVNNYLFPGGIFIFDFNTIYKYEEVIGDTTIAENREDCSFIWENFYSCEDHINEYDVTVFERQEDDLYRKFTETHYQRGYSLNEMKAFLEKAGLTFVTAMDEKTHEAPTETSERIYVIAREHGKQ